MHFEQVRQLSASEGWSCLRQLQLWLASFPADESAHILRCLCGFLKAFQGHAPPPTLEDIYKGGGLNDPSLAGLQRAGNGDDGGDRDDAEAGEDDDVSGWLDKASCLPPLSRPHSPR